jgi:hypothetical protein
MSHAGVAMEQAEIIQRQSKRVSSLESQNRMLIDMLDAFVTAENLGEFTEGGNPERLFEQARSVLRTVGRSQ